MVVIVQLLYMHSFVGIAPYDDPQVVMFLTFKSGDSYAQYMPNIVKQTMNEALQVVNRYNAKNTTAVDQKLYFRFLYKSIC